jgi:hypothetical protein
VAATERARYRFGPLERRGLIAGWRGGQVAAVAVGLVIGVGLVRARPSPAGVGVALVGVATGLAVACWPVRGRTVEQWLPLVARAGVRRITGRTVAVTAVPFHVPGGRLRVGSRSARRTAGPFAGCCVLASPSVDPGPIAGVVKDIRARTYTSVIAVQGCTFALLEEDEKQRRVAAWAAVLSGMARERSVIHRLQWVERSLPDHGDGLERYLRDRAVADSPPAALDSYRDLVSASAPVTQRHELLLAVSLHAGHSARSVRAAGGGDLGACRVLGRELRALENQLAAADVVVCGTLSPRVLTQAIRRGFESAARTGSVAATGEPNELLRDPTPGWPWPFAVEDGWSSLRTDGTWHSTYWVAEWPRVDVGADFMAPLLLQAGVRRAVAVTMEPVSPLRAAREVERARTADLADAELRRRGGFLDTARRRREEESVIRRETELADGHAQYRFSGYVTVTAGSEEALEVGCGQIEQAAGQARLELVRMYGAQDAGFACTLPLGRGLA